MKKPIIIIALILSLLISIFINFTAYSILSLITGSIIFALIIFGIQITTAKLIQSIKEKKLKKTILLGAVLFIITTIFTLGYIGFSPIRTRIIAGSLPYFKTNIFTGECSFGMTSKEFYKPTPWYYKSDCEISVEEKVEYVKRSEYYDNIIDACNFYCEEEASEVYCKDYILNAADGISCKDLISCNAISCTLPK